MIWRCVDDAALADEAAALAERLAAMPVQGAGRTRAAPSPPPTTWTCPRR